MNNNSKEEPLIRRHLEATLDRYLNDGALQISWERDKLFPEGAAGPLSSRLHEALIDNTLDKCRIDHKLIRKRNKKVIKKLEKTKRALTDINKNALKIVPLMNEIYDLKSEQGDIKQELLDQQLVFAALDSSQLAEKKNTGGDGNDDDDNNDNKTNPGSSVALALPSVPVLSPDASELGPPKGILKKKKLKINDQPSVKMFNLCQEEINYKRKEDSEAWSDTPY